MYPVADLNLSFSLNDSKLYLRVEYLSVNLNFEFAIDLNKKSMFILNHETAIPRNLERLIDQLKKIPLWLLEVPEIQKILCAYLLITNWRTDKHFFKKLKLKLNRIKSNIKNMQE